MLRRFINNCEIYFYVILLNNEKILINNQINEIINKFKLMGCQVETSIYGLKINKKSYKPPKAPFLLSLAP